MNQVLDAQYLASITGLAASAEPIESVTRLAVGLEPADAVRRARTGFGVTVAVDGVPHPPSSLDRDPGPPWWRRQDVLARMRRNDSCRHLFVFRFDPAHPGVRVRDPARRGPPLTIEDQLDVRVWDDTRRFVPRRLRLRLPDLPAKGRVVRPALFPGAAYDVPAGAVGCRGRVLRDGKPMRWARVVARRGTEVVGRAHGDDRGEFLLLLASGAAQPAELEFPIRVSVTVHGPDVKPDPAATPRSAVDPLWDLPREVVAAGSAGDEVLDGTTLPDGYREPSRNALVEVEFGPDGPVSRDFVFT